MSKLRRRPDGKPEFRSLDQLLAEAAQDDVVQRLPGKGRPIDLGDYLHADPESRVANKLLADHNVIPQPLQDRREAEKLAELAEIDAAAALADLGARRCRVAELQEQLLLAATGSSIGDLHPWPSAHLVGQYRRSQCRRR